MRISISGSGARQANSCRRLASGGQSAVCSCSDNEEIRQTLRGLRLRRMTPKTITDPAKLRRELNRVRLQGFAVDDEETELGGCCVAVPVYGKERQVLAAVSIMGPTQRVNSGSIPRFAKMVRVAAREISRALGCESGGALSHKSTS